MRPGFIDRIRRRETPFYDRLYRFARWILAVNVPVVRPLHALLRVERDFRRAVWGRGMSLLYHEPLFKTRCDECGRALRLIGGIPQVYGNLVLRIGNGVTMHGASTFVGGKAHPCPVLQIGDHTLLGYQMEIAVGTRVTIGRHVLVGSRVSLIGYDFHPLNAVDRLDNLPPDSSGAGDITIGDYAWVGMNCIVLKGVSIGEGAVVGAGSIVTRDVPPYTLVAGSPARVLKSIEGPRPTS